MTRKTKIINESGDRKYFTIIPNYILNHSTLWDREVYIQMKRITGEDGTCWTSQKNLAKQCGISINRLKKSIQYLIKNKWIEFVGNKSVSSNGGLQETKEYKVIDLWHKNIQFYKGQGVSSNDIPNTKGVSRDDQRGITSEAKGVSPGDDKEEPILNKNTEEEQEGFILFWNKYPKKINKHTAKKSFEKLKPGSKLLKVILESVAKFKETKEWKKDNGQFIPYPATWLNNKRWEDEVEIISKPKRFNCNKK